MFISSAFAQTAPAAGGDMQSSLMSMLPLVLMFVVLYFVMIRPPLPGKKDPPRLGAGRPRAPDAPTAGGVVGKVTRLDDNYLGLEIASGVEIQVQRSAVVQVLPKGTLK